MTDAEPSLEVLKGTAEPACVASVTEPSPDVATVAVDDSDNSKPTQINTDILDPLVEQTTSAIPRDLAEPKISPENVDVNEESIVEEPSPPEDEINSQTEVPMTDTNAETKMAEPDVPEEKGKNSEIALENVDVTKSIVEEPSAPEADINSQTEIQITDTKAETEAAEQDVPAKKGRKLPDLENTDDLSAWLSGFNKDLASFVQVRKKEKEEEEAEAESAAAVKTKLEEEGRESEVPGPAMESTSTKGVQDIIGGAPEQGKEKSLPDINDKASFNAWMSRISGDIERASKLSESLDEEKAAASSCAPDASLKSATNTNTHQNEVISDKTQSQLVASREKKVPDISNRSELNTWLASISRDLEKLTQRANEDLPSGDPQIKSGQPTEAEKGLDAQPKPDSSKQLVADGSEKKLKPILKNESSAAVTSPVDRKAAHVTFAFKTNREDPSEGNEGAGNMREESVAEETEKDDAAEAQPVAAAAAEPQARVTAEAAAPIVQAIREQECSLELVLDSIASLESEVMGVVGDFSKLTKKLAVMQNNLQFVKRSTEDLLARQNEDLESYNELD